MRPRERLIVAANVGLMLALLVTPLAALVERSLTVSTTEGVSLELYRQLLDNTRDSAFYVPPAAAVRRSVSCRRPRTRPAVGNPFAQQRGLAKAGRGGDEGELAV